MPRDHATDVANSGTCTGPTVFDAYELSGRLLWRVNHGTNVRDGRHYDSFQVFDHDRHGKAEMVARTSDGPEDAAGTVIGDGNASHLEGNCAVISGAPSLCGPPRSGSGTAAPEPLRTATCRFARSSASTAGRVPVRRRPGLPAGVGCRRQAATRSMRVLSSRRRRGCPVGRPRR
ncbi:hypothetical protein [Streptomyces sp. NPDC048428]|uniref:rhamnogalacturonan lyase family protein n=1 Tax=Streptomyces sp. NPDC048428 TaxID=3154503 RepID=UPI00343A7355